MARRFDALARLWDAVGDYEVGLLPRHLPRVRRRRGSAGIVDRVMAITGRIDLVHANNSRDAFDSGADRHDNLDSGTSTRSWWSR